MFQIDFIAQNHKMKILCVIRRDGIRNEYIREGKLRLRQS